MGVFGLFGPPGREIRLGHLDGVTGVGGVPIAQSLAVQTKGVHQSEDVGDMFAVVSLSDVSSLPRVAIVLPIVVPAQLDQQIGGDIGGGQVDVLAKIDALLTLCAVGGLRVVEDLLGLVEAPFEKRRVAHVGHLNVMGGGRGVVGSLDQTSSGQKTGGDFQEVDHG